MLAQRRKLYNKKSKIMAQQGFLTRNELCGIYTASESTFMDTKAVDLRKDRDVWMIQHHRFSKGVRTRAEIPHPINFDHCLQNPTKTHFGYYKKEPSRGA